MSVQGDIHVIGAAWLATMNGELLRDGAVAVQNGRILAFGWPATNVLEEYPGATYEDLGDAIILPGLVNSHTHLELSLCEETGVPSSFVDWILALRARSRLDGTNDAAVMAEAVERGVAECLRFGVTTVGDIGRLVAMSRPVLARLPLRTVSYGEVLAIATFRDRAAQQIEAAIDRSEANDRLTIGITPHAPYTVEPDTLRRCVAVAKEHCLPLAMHVAELPYETDFLANGVGPFRELLERVGKWDDQIPRFTGGPIRFAQAAGLLEYPSLLAHVNYCDDDELAILAKGQASVVYCPRTHAYFGHPPHRWREMLAAGINVAVGTDSRASSPDLNLVDDLRLLRRISPEVPAADLWAMATTRAAKAIGNNAVGSIAVGKAADFVAFEAESPDPLESILQNQVPPKRVWIGGRPVAG